MKWSRAARTDKGVHAIGNCVALRVLLPKREDMAGLPCSHDREVVDDLIQRVNSNLPQGFYSTSSCDILSWPIVHALGAAHAPSGQVSADLSGLFDKVREDDQHG